MNTSLTTVSRDDVREMVETNWRKFLTFAQEGTPSKPLAVEVLKRFEEQIAQTAAGMGPAQAKEFLAICEDERARIFDEYTDNPDALKRRLGVGAPSFATQTRRSTRMPMGELAARTAVRATVWTVVRDVITSLFRGLR